MRNSRALLLLCLLPIIHRSFGPTGPAKCERDPSLPAVVSSGSFRRFGGGLVPPGPSAAEFAAQRTCQSFGVLLLLVDLICSYNPSSVTGHAKRNFNDPHRGCRDLTAFRSEAELFFSPWDVDNYLIV